MKHKVAVSILSADFSRLGEEVKNIERAGADMIHIDVMDGSFVPNITIGASVVKSIRKTSSLPFDVHLMVKDPAHLIEQFALSGADIITVHVEAMTHIDKIIDYIHSFGIKAGISLVPSTNECVLKYIYQKIDMVLVMTVNPGYAGQQFIPSQLQKIANIRQQIDQINPLIDLAVDGGIDAITGRSCIESGANILISGSYIFNGNYKDNIDKLKTF